MKIFEKACPNCGGNIEWISWKADCRGNDGGNAINCVGICKRNFPVDEARELPAYLAFVEDARKKGYWQWTPSDPIIRMRG